MLNQEPGASGVLNSTFNISHSTFDISSLTTATADRQPTVPFHQPWRRPLVLNSTFDISHSTFDISSLTTLVRYAIIP